jgi:hypothetical protein
MKMATKSSLGRSQSWCRKSHPSNKRRGAEFRQMSGPLFTPNQGHIPKFRIFPECDLKSIPLICGLQLSFAEFPTIQHHLAKTIVVLCG